MSWKNTTLGSVCQLYQPQTLSKNELDQSGQYKVYGANGVIGLHTKYNHAESQVLITCRGATCGTVNVSEPYSWINGNAMVVRPKQNDIDFGFLAHYLKHIDMSQVITGAAQPQITRLSLSPLKVSLPPLAEQQRIAAILDKAEEIRHKREQSIAKLDQLAQSTFEEMFGRDTCETKILNELGTIKTGSTPPSNKENMFGTQIPFITPGDLSSGSQVKRHLTIEGSRESTTVRAGAALVCCIGSIGKMDIAKEVSAFNQQINAIEWSGEINDTYGLYALKSIKGQVISNATSTTLPILKKSLFQQLRIKVPSQLKQLQFSERIECIQQSITEQKKSLTKIAVLCSSLQHQAFTTGFDA